MSTQAQAGGPLEELLAGAASEVVGVFECTCTLTDAV